MTFLSIPLWDIACPRPVRLHTFISSSLRLPARPSSRIRRNRLIFHLSSLQKWSSSLVSLKFECWSFFKHHHPCHRPSVFIQYCATTTIFTPSHNHGITTMPRLEDTQTQVYDHDEEDDLLNRNRRRVVRLWEDFIDFAFQGNVLEIAFGLM